MMGKWYSTSIRQVEAELKTDRQKGLSRKEVKARRQKRGTNDVFTRPRSTYLSYLGHLLADIPTILLLLTVLIAVIFEDRVTLIAGLCVLAIYLFGAVLGYVRAQNVLDEMGENALPLAKVLREGKLYLVKQKNLVPGDVIFLSGGDIVPCDARLIEAEELQALETNLTTVTRTVSKSADFVGWGDLPPSHQRNMVFASTVLTSGKAKAIVCEVGQDTMVCKLGRNKPVVTHEDLKIFTTLQKISRIWSICMMVMIFLITGANLVMGVGGDGLFDTFLTALSLAVSSLSEYYMPFGFLIVGCSIYAAVRKHRDIRAGAMIKDIGKLDRIRNVDALLVPLEGIFTVGDHRVESAYAGDDEYDTEHKGYAKNCTELIRCALLSTGLYGADALGKNNLTGNNVYSPEEEAIISAAQHIGIYHAELDKHYPLLEHRGIGTMNHLETSIVRHEEKNIAVVRGGVQEILLRCTSFRLDGRMLPMTLEKRSQLTVAALKMAKRACRVVAVASGETEYTKVVKPALIQKDLVFEGFLAIRESILPGVAMNVGKCREWGISVILMTDEEEQNGIGFAKAIGLIHSEDEAISGEKIKKNAAWDWQTCGNYRLYIGLSLSQKRALIRAMKKQGKTVGVMAQDLSEIALYREADVAFSQSIAISATPDRLGVEMTSRRIPIFSHASKQGSGGCEALKFVSDVTVTEATPSGEGGFNAILQALQTAKGIFINLHRAVRYLLTVQTARIGIVIISLLSEKTLLSPVQILYTGLIVDFFAILTIAFTAPSSSAFTATAFEQQKERSVIRLLLGHITDMAVGIVWALMTVALPSLIGLFGVDMTPSVTLTLVFASFQVAQWFVLLLSGISEGKTRRKIRLNSFMLLSLTLQISFFALCMNVDAIGKWFDCTSLSLPAWIGIAVLPLLLVGVWVICRALKKCMENQRMMKDGMIGDENNEQPV